jgi:hypothetical protein
VAGITGKFDCYNLVRAGGATTHEEFVNSIDRSSGHEQRYLTLWTRTIKVNVLVFSLTVYFKGLKLTRHNLPIPNSKMNC